LVSLCNAVEDSAFIAKLVVRMLSARGHTVESASNGSEGLARLTAAFGTAADFDFVLCDFQMPVCG
jgi:two-component system cell cycle response regulator CpdR